MVFYSICIVFANSNPIVQLAGLYLFMIRHFGDFTSLLTVHLCEIDSNGKFINRLINYAYTPILIFQIFMIFDCINRGKLFETLIVGLITVLSLIYYLCIYDSDYMMAIYSYNKQFDNFRSNNLLGSSNNIKQAPISHNEIIKWTNKYRHPLTIPAFVNDDDVNFIPSYQKKSGISQRPKKRTDE